MISIERARPVNPPGSTSFVSRADVWRGLVLKANNALPFVPAMTHCEVLERESDSTFIREIEFRGDRMRERVTLEPERRVTFERLSGAVLGTIRNFIEEDSSGQLLLRFAFDLEVKGLAAGSAAEKEYAARMEKDYLGAVDATLNAIRKLHDETSAPPARPAQPTAPPTWLTEYYGDVDAQRGVPGPPHSGRARCLRQSSPGRRPRGHSRRHRRTVGGHRRTASSVCQCLGRRINHDSRERRHLLPQGR
jgi:hypothetical protein